MSKFLRNQSGATPIEYGLIAALIVVVVFIAISQFTGHKANKISNRPDKICTVRDVKSGLLVHRPC